MSKLFVWDFHGVLEEGNENAVREISNCVLAEHGYPERFSDEDISTLYGRKWYEYFTHLLPGESVDTHVALQAACQSYPEARNIINRYVRPTPQSHGVLREVQDSGNEQVLISNCSPRSLEFFIDCCNVRQFFPDGRRFAVSAHAPGCHVHKNLALEEFLKGRQYGGIVIIGDSPADMELVQVRGGVTYLYTHPGKQFRECPADYRINDLRELLREI
jgi:phosphoglycolate phosphatase-like HAD superfamily hydrolase